MSKKRQPNELGRLSLPTGWMAILMVAVLQGVAGYLSHIHYRIETAFDQLVQRFHAKRVWVRDLWYLTSRWMRKFLP